MCAGRNGLTGLLSESCYSIDPSSGDWTFMSTMPGNFTHRTDLAYAYHPDWGLVVAGSRYWAIVDGIINKSL